MCVCYSVWDALTDNYISKWDGQDAEGLNGNLSDQEVTILNSFELECSLAPDVFALLFLHIRRRF